MREIRKYIANDGTVFETSIDCQEYEKNIEKEEKKKKSQGTKRMSDEFLMSVGFDVTKHKTTAELNQALNHTWLVFDAYGNFQCLKTCGYGADESDGIKFDFKYISGDDRRDSEIMENWLRSKKFYAHALSSFSERQPAEFYEWNLKEKLEFLTWEFKDGKIIKAKW